MRKEGDKGKGGWVIIQRQKQSRKGVYVAFTCDQG